MKTSALLAIVITAAGLGVSAIPAQAATMASCSINVPITDNEGTYIESLRAQGVDAQGVSEWDGCLKVDVTKVNGGSGVAIFDPATLQQVAGDDYATLS